MDAGIILLDYTRFMIVEEYRRLADTREWYTKYGEVEEFVGEPEWVRLYVPCEPSFSSCHFLCGGEGVTGGCG